MKNMLKDYLIISIGLVIVAIGISFFLIPAELATGGITGLGIIINKIFPSVTIGFSMTVMNLALFVVAFFLIDSQFGSKTVYASFGLSAVIWIFEKTCTLGLLTNDLLLNLFFGTLIKGIGMGIIFYQNASTGGTDIVAKILNKFFHIDIGKSLLLVDFFIVLMAGLTFGIELGLYALLGVILNGLIIDYVIGGFNRKINVSIVSLYPEKIRDFITCELRRGATIYTAEGAYTHDPRSVIMTVMSKSEFIKLRGFIKSIDQKAFVTVSNVHQVLGEGFKFIE